MPCPHLLPQPQQGALPTAWMTGPCGNLDLVALPPWVCPASPRDPLQIRLQDSGIVAPTSPYWMLTVWKSGRQKLETTFPGSLSQAVEEHVDVTFLVSVTSRQLFSLLSVLWPLRSIFHCCLQSGNTHQGQSARRVLLPSSSWCPLSALLSAPSHIRSLQFGRASSTVQASEKKVFVKCNSSLP